MPTGIRIDATPEQLDQVTFDHNGLVPAIAQDIGSRDVLMMAWMNAESLRRTFDEGRMVYWSRAARSCGAKAIPAATANLLREAYYDCDGDTLLFLVEQEGSGACHTGARTGFYRSFGPESDAAS